MCPYHRNLCAYPEWRPDICEYCHAPWETITAPATRTTIRHTFTRPKRGQTPQPITVEDVQHLFGYGDTPLGHLWRHAVDLAFAEAEIERLAAKRRRVA